MLGFIKKLFGFGTTPSSQCSDSVTQPDGNECKSTAPYKVETPVVDLADIAIAQQPAPVVNSQITDAVTAAPAQKKKGAPRKQGAPKKTGSNKPASGRPRGPRKTKAKPASK